MICGEKNLEQDRPSDIASGLICANSLLQIKHKAIWAFASGILPRNKGNNYRKYRLQRTNSVLKDWCSKIPETRIKLDKEKRGNSYYDNSCYTTGAITKVKKSVGWTFGRHFCYCKGAAKCQSLITSCIIPLGVMYLLVIILDQYKVSKEHHWI